MRKASEYVAEFCSETNTETVILLSILSLGMLKALEHDAVSRDYAVSRLFRPVLIKLAQEVAGGETLETLFSAAGEEIEWPMSTESYAAQLQTLQRGFIGQLQKVAPQAANGPKWLRKINGRVLEPLDAQAPSKRGSATRQPSDPRSDKKRIRTKK